MSIVSSTNINNIMSTTTTSLPFSSNESLKPVVAALQTFLERLDATDVVEHQQGQFQGRRTFTIILAPRRTASTKKSVWLESELSVGPEGNELLLSHEELVKKLEKCKIPNTLCLQASSSKRKKKRKTPKELAARMKKLRDSIV